MWVRAPGGHRIRVGTVFARTDVRRSALHVQTYTSGNQVRVSMIDQSRFQTHDEQDAPRCNRGTRFIYRFLEQPFILDSWMAVGITSCLDERCLCIF